MRNAFAEEMVRLGEADPRLVLLSGDIGNKLFDPFKERCPGRFFNCGIAEANMMGVAAGMALSGLRPVVYTITPFTTTRCFEQIRVDVCYHHAPVIIVGTGSGLSYAELGPTHHSCEDLAILRTLPGMTVFAPCDKVELRLGLAAGLQQDGPLYMRIGKKGEPVIHKETPDFALGKMLTVRQGDEICLLVTGTMMAPALEAADRLAATGRSVRVESVHTVKPLDEERLAEIFHRCRLVAAIEEHGRIGGLAGAVAEWAARGEALGRTRFLSFGVEDRFMHDVGSQDYARAQFGLSAEAMANAVASAWAGEPVRAAG